MPTRCAQGTYQLSADVAEPDPYVVDLNSSLAECDECAAGSLAATERQCVATLFIKEIC
jgi:exocyst complex component 4